MGIKSKKTGGYNGAIAVHSKKAGAYLPTLNQFVKSGGVYTSIVDPIKIATFGDSRATIAIGPGPDLYDGSQRQMRVALTNQPTSAFTLLQYMRDCVLVADGGVSGSSPNGWSSASRTNGKTVTAINAIDWDVMYVVGYATNDVQGVTTTTTRDSVAVASIGYNQGIINAFLASGRVVVWETVMQRSEAGYSNTNTVLKQQCCDYINFGDGSAIAGMKAWIQAHPAYGTELFLHDVMALTNLGGVSTGAFADTAKLGDGIHIGYYGARVIAASLRTLLRSIFPDRYRTRMYRSGGANLIPAVSATYYGGETLSNCTKSAITYGTDANGQPYGEVTITPNNTAAGSYKFELLPDIGTNGGRTPAGGVLVAGDKVQARVMLTVDNGSGGASVVNNILQTVYISYIGGTPALQGINNGVVGQGTSLPSDADIAAQYMPMPFTMAGGSDLIGAPAAGSGMRIYMQLYFGITPTPFRVRWTAPEIRKVA